MEPLIRMKERVFLTNDREKLALCKLCLSSTSQMYTYVLGCHLCPPKCHLANTIPNVLTLRAATFHVAGSYDKKGTIRVTSLSSTCSPVAHEDEGLHADYFCSL